MTTWAIDPVHTIVSFGVKHMSFSTFRGRFKQVEGTVRLDEANPANSAVNASIDVSSIVIEGERLYGVMLDKDFFLAEQHPKMTFVSTRIQHVDDRNWKVYGNLTIRDVSREVPLSVEFLGQGVHPFSKKTVAGFHAAAEIDRTDFGLKWNAMLDTGAHYLGERVQITLDIEAVKQE